MAGFFEFGEYKFDSEKRLLWRRGELVALPPKAAEVLSLLIENRGNLVERREILERVWTDTFVEEANVNYAISVLRKTLGGDGIIQTIPRRGYRFNAKLNVIDHPIDAELLIERRTVSETVIEQVEHTDKILSGTLARRPFVLAGAAILVFVIVFVVAFGWKGIGARTERERSVSTSPSRSIALIPFRVINGTNVDNELVEGIAENLTGRLGTLKNVAIRPVGSVSAATRNESDPIAVGRKLSVDYVITGSFQRDADRIRLLVQLLNVSASTQIWTAQFDEREQDFFGLQDSLATQVSSQLFDDAQFNQQIAEKKRPTEDLDAYKLYLRGRYEWSKRNDDGFKKSIAAYREAIDRDPSFALAYAGLADAYALLADYNIERPSEAFPKAKAAASKALELDPSLTQPRTTFAYILATFDWDYAEAERQYRTVLENQPNDATTHQWLGEMLYALKRFDESEIELRKAVELDPLVPITHSEIAAMFYYMGRYDESLAAFRSLSLDHPTFATGHIFSAWIFDLKGMPDESFAEELSYWKVNHADQRVLDALSKAYQNGGRNAFLKQVAAEFENGAKQGAFPSYKIAHTYARLRDREKTLEWIEKCLDERSPNIVKISVDPNFEFLKQDPQFQAAIARLNLPQKAG
jgi:DNA-binding winged helix-turn-helix (wHTH) protein/TolB-like protein